MTDGLVLAAVALVAIAVPMALVWRAGRASRPWIGEMPRELGPFPGVLLFTSSTCPTCPPASEIVNRVAGEVRELTWPSDTVAFHKLGVGSVPATFVVNRAGKVVDTFEGVPEERRLTRAVRKAGL